ncbi:hypothetical protein EVAR_65078_1 [Eumeta japonica]|uniref:Uncharacterized protein n=1 Tax=Eumeta variegata TaxID=151549 RepID=A0A4C2A8E9_EUMVA|nr:hypothetical protein EVAR_65078_1 [Eumeta japonica]
MGAPLAIIERADDSPPQHDVIKLASRATAPGSRTSAGSRAPAAHHQYILSKTFLTYDPLALIVNNNNNYYVQFKDIYSRGVTMMGTMWPIVAVYLVVTLSGQLWKVHAEVYTALVDMEPILETQKRIIDDLEAYIGKEENRLDSLRRYV